MVSGVALAVLLAGCEVADPHAPSPVAQAPVSFGDGAIDACAPAEIYSHLAYGQVVSLDGDESATILAVRFPEVRDLDLGRILLQRDLSHAVGVQSFPAGETPWPGVVPAVGATLPGGHRPAELVLEVWHHGAEPGFVGRTEIDLDIGGVAYTATAENTLTIGRC